MEYGSRNEEFLNEVLEFIERCDKAYNNNIFPPENAVKAKEYIKIIDKFSGKKSSVCVGIRQKLEFIKNQIDINNYGKFDKDAVLNLLPLSVANYVYELATKRVITNPILIARFVYIELCKVLYYDISYHQQNNEQRKIICNTKIDVTKEKVFSYIVCTQFIELYKYILSLFDINVDICTIPGQDHVWGEIKLNDKNIIVVDATDYINGSIDLSNAKANNPTVGFVILPKELSGVRILDIYTDPRYWDVRDKMDLYYEYNRELDIDLGYINKRGYRTERIIKENELFSKDKINKIRNVKEYLEEVSMFFKNLKIPNNMDGYEVFAFYNSFIKRLPIEISSNILPKNIFVSSFDYKVNHVRKKFIQVPNDYLDYLLIALSEKYYKYLTEEEKNDIYESIKKGTVGIKEVSKEIAKREMEIANINRKLNRFYTINKLSVFDPGIGEEMSIQLYEPFIGKIYFDSINEYDKYAKELIISPKKISSKK